MPTALMTASTPTSFGSQSRADRSRVKSACTAVRAIDVAARFDHGVPGRAQSSGEMTADEAACSGK